MTHVEETKTPKERILDAAIDLFAQKGFAATGVRELAQHAEVNLAMINYYFGSKQGVLKEIIDDFFSLYLDVLKNKLEGEVKPRNLEDLTTTFVSAIVDFMRQRPAQTRVVFTELPSDMPELADFKASYVRQLLPTAVPLLSEYIQPYRKGPIPIDIIGPSIVGIVIAHFLMRPVIHQIFPQEFDDAYYDRYKKEISRIVLRGFAGVLPEIDQPEPCEKEENHD